MIKKLLADMQPRERQLVIAAAALVVFFIAYLLLWQPYGGKHLQSLQEKVAEQRVTLAWMQEAAVRAQQLRSGSSQAGSGQSLMTVVDQTAKHENIGEHHHTDYQNDQHTDGKSLPEVQYAVISCFFEFPDTENQENREQQEPVIKK